ncbi:MAG TPA: hypothetical protein IAD07_00450 [Candidatus Fimivicinus intestinavium]|nr:hypothetical protein [Candidatus Fimivicinus intestinavium]
MKEYEGDCTLFEKAWRFFGRFLPSIMEAEKGKNRVERLGEKSGLSAFLWNLFYRTC